MNTKPVIRGMAWDHPRATLPLRAISSEWAASHGVDVEWTARPLVAFEDQPLEELATAYDLVLIDHPFVGFAAQSGLISPVEDWVDAAYLADQKSGTVGPSYRSYTWDNRQWALAIDAACQVSASRDDLWDQEIGGDLPDTWADVLNLAIQQAGPTARIGVALNPNHAYCAFLSIGVTEAGDRFWRHDASFDRDLSVNVLNQLRRLSDVVHPACLDSDPIALSDLMSTTNEIAYSALMFGYSNYSRTGFRDHLLTFHDAPTGPSARRGSVLGGVGISVSSRTRVFEQAAALARHLVAPTIQSGVYVETGGQPGHAAAWKADRANDLTRNFFRNTVTTMEEAWLRPRTPGHRAFQEAAGHAVNAFLKDRRVSPADCVDTLNALVERHLAADRPMMTGTS